MASRLFQSSAMQLTRPSVAIAVGLATSMCLRQQFGHPRAHRLDSPMSAFSTSRPVSTQEPFLKTGKLSPKVVRQISTGSILGVLAGLGVSVFSKPLAIIFGLVIVGVQMAESYGIRVVPYKSIQRYFKGIDVKSTLQENVPLKVSFGLLFALTGFAEFSQDP